MGANSEENKESFWTFLLSHHPPEEYHRCLQITIAGRTFHSCARCTGSYFGFVCGILMVYYSIPLPILWVDIIIFLFPAPGIIDWGTQTFNLRESRNSIRVITGLLYGFAIPIAVQELVYGLLWYRVFPVKPVASFIIYFILLGLVTYRRSKD